MARKRGKLAVIKQEGKPIPPPHHDLTSSLVFFLPGLVAPSSLNANTGCLSLSAFAIPLLSLGFQRACILRVDVMQQMVSDLGRPGYVRTRKGRKYNFDD